MIKESMRMIPLVDLRSQYAELRNEMEKAIGEVFSSGVFVNGQACASFEREFAHYCGAAGCAATGNGTDALYLALRALGAGPGDEVITTANTFIATAEAITLNGSTPVFVDIDERTMLIDPESIESAITPRTKAIIPVHLYGQPCGMDAIMEIAGRHGVHIVEDAAQAHGALWKGKRAGSIGTAGCFSFFPGKNLGAFGDGGAIISQNENVVQSARMLRNHGRKDKYIHEMEGVNSRLDEIQAAALRVKLKRLDAWNGARRRIAAAYMEALNGAEVILPATLPGAEPVWHLFVIRISNREDVRNRLAEKGVTAGIHYPVPLHLQPAYRRLGMAKGSLPRAERAAEMILSLPIYPELRMDDMEYITGIVRENARLE